MTMSYEIFIATLETLYMVTISTIFAILLGLPIGTLLFCSNTINPNKNMSNFINNIINISRSIPFIILLVALIPITRFIVGTSIGIHATIVPLTLGATPFFARLVSNVYTELPYGLIETGFSLGATTWQLIRYILFPEALPALIQAITITAITVLNYSAMAGTVGGGGLGDLAIRYGYQRFNMIIMFITIVILVIIVQLLQIIGDYYAKRCNHK